jgi:hypothetical protein
VPNQYSKSQQAARSARNPASSSAIVAQPLKDNPMKTTELVDAVAAANDISKAKAKEVVNSVLVTIIDAPAVSIGQTPGQFATGHTLLSKRKHGKHCRRRGANPGFGGMSGAHRAAFVTPHRVPTRA